MTKIRLYEEGTIGNWDLKEYGIRHVIIPPTQVQQLQVGTNSNMGVLKKFNIVSPKGDMYYVKSGKSKGKLFSILQPLMEVICYRIGKLLGFNVTQYNLWVIDEHLFAGQEDKDALPEDDCFTGMEDHSANDDVSLEKTLVQHNKVLISLSKSFIRSNETFTTCESAYAESTKGAQLYTDLSILGSEIRKSIDQMIIFDAIIDNTDRHKRNFGFLKSENGDYRLAPLYDHGLALLADFSEYELQEHGMDVTTFKQGQPFGSLTAAVKHIDPASVNGIRFDLTVEELYAVVDEFADLFTPRRLRIIKRLLEVRWNYVRNLFSSV